jgi:hypothetical protein
MVLILSSIGKKSRGRHFFGDFSMRHSGFRSLQQGRLVGGAFCLLALTACSYLPWSKKAPAAPTPVNELVIAGADGAPTQGFPQYWKRNTLVVDLQSASGTGGITLKPGEAGKFPVRVAFRVMPGTIGLLEVQADQRMLLPVTRDGTKPVDLELVPGVYNPKSTQISVKWEPAK